MYILLIVYKNYSHWESKKLYKNIVQCEVVGYQSPGSWFVTLFLTVAMGNSRNAWNRREGRSTLFKTFHATDMSTSYLSRPILIKCEATSHLNIRFDHACWRLTWMAIKNFIPHHWKSLQQTFLIYFMLLLLETYCYEVSNGSVVLPLQRTTSSSSVMVVLI